MCNILTTSFWNEFDKFFGYKHKIFSFAIIT